MSSDRAAGGGLALLAVVVLWESRRLPFGTLTAPGPGYAPVVLALGLLLAALLVAAAGRDAPPLTHLGWSEWRHAAAILGACAFAALALERLGYRLTTGLVVLALVAALERKPPVAAVVFAAALATGSFLVFDTFLRVPLPRGPFGF